MLYHVLASTFELLLKAFGYIFLAKHNRVCCRIRVIMVICTPASKYRHATSLLWLSNCCTSFISGSRDSFINDIIWCFYCFNSSTLCCLDDSYTCVRLNSSIQLDYFMTFIKFFEPLLKCWVPYPFQSIKGPTQVFKVKKIVWVTKVQLLLEVNFLRKGKWD